MKLVRNPKYPAWSVDDVQAWRPLTPDRMACDRNRPTCLPFLYAGGTTGPAATRTISLGLARLSGVTDWSWRA